MHIARFKNVILLKSKIQDIKLMRLLEACVSQGSVTHTNGLIFHLSFTGFETDDEGKCNAIDTLLNK